MDIQPVKETEDIMKYIITFIIGLLIGLSGFFSEPEPEIKIVKQTEIRWKPHQTAYNERREVLIDRLMCYDLSEPRLTGGLKNSVFTVNAGLCERDWSREFTLDAGSAENWKFYVGIGVACIIAGSIAGATLF